MQEEKNLYELLEESKGEEKSSPLIFPETQYNGKVEDSYWNDEEGRDFEPDSEGGGEEIYFEDWQVGDNVTCNDFDSDASLTIGKKYEILDIDANDDTIQVKDDRGNDWWIDCYSFEMYND